MMFRISNSIGSAVLQSCYTALLFTWTDFKTIFFPVTAFACSTAPVHSFSRLLHACCWIWIHLLLCSVSNQIRGKREDMVNRPWRPLPSERISRRQAVVLRWTLVISCSIWSASYGSDVFVVTLVLTVTTLLYDEMGMSGHPIGKNLCCVFGYVSFEIGATKLIGFNRQLDMAATTTIVLSGALIFTTIQAQDFADVEGDMAIRRITLPIFAPELSRVLILLAMITWSAILGWYWGVGTVTKTALLVLGGYIGFRYFLKRSTADDKRSYVLFNVWLMIAHSLPIQKRTGILSF